MSMEVIKLRTRFIGNEPENEEIKELGNLQRELAAESKPVEPEKPDPVVTKISRRGRATRLVNFRKDPMQSSPVTDVVMIGSVVDILGSERDCYKIRYKGKEGYAKKYAFVEVR